MKTRKKLLIAGGLLLAPALLAGIAAAADGADPDVARTEAVRARDLFAAVSGNGLIQPTRKVDVSADVPGRVVRVAVKEGDWVAKGALLLQIDDTRQRSSVLRAQAAVAQAGASAEQVRANLVQARANLARSLQLSGDHGWVTAADLDQLRSQVAMLEAQLRAAEFAVQQSQASLAEARDALEKCTITAPMSGRVTRLNIQEGETAVPGSPNNPGSLLVTIADLSAMEARVRVDETDVPSIQVGDRATVHVDAFPQAAFEGRVVGVSNSASRSGGAQSAHFQVVVALDPTKVPLHPELSASADIVTDVRRHVLAVPIMALTARTRDGHRADPSGEGGPLVEGVFVWERGTVRWQPVKVGIVGKRFLEVTSGLEAGETVVAGSYALVKELEDGDEVQARPARAADVPPRG